MGLSDSNNIRRTPLSNSIRRSNHTNRAPATRLIPVQTRQPPQQLLLVERAQPIGLRIELPRRSIPPKEEPNSNAEVRRRHSPWSCPNRLCPTHPGNAARLAWDISNHDDEDETDPARRRWRYAVRSGETKGGFVQAEHGYRGDLDSSIDGIVIRPPWLIRPSSGDHRSIAMGSASSSARFMPSTTSRPARPAGATPRTTSGPGPAVGGCWLRLRAALEPLSAGPVCGPMPRVRGPRGQSARRRAALSGSAPGKDSRAAQRRRRTRPRHDEPGIFSRGSERMFPRGSARECLRGSQGMF